MLQVLQLQVLQVVMVLFGRGDPAPTLSEDFVVRLAKESTSPNGEWWTCLSASVVPFPTPAHPIT